MQLKNASAERQNLIWILKCDCELNSVNKSLGCCWGLGGEGRSFLAEGSAYAKEWGLGLCSKIREQMGIRWYLKSMEEYYER